MSTIEGMSNREIPQRSNATTQAKPHENSFSYRGCCARIYALAHKVFVQCFWSEDAVPVDEQDLPSRRDALTRLSDASLKDITHIASMEIDRADVTSKEEQQRQRSLSEAVSDLRTMSSAMEFDQSSSFTSISFHSISSRDDSASKRSSQQLDQSFSSISFQSPSDVAMSTASLEAWMFHPKCLIEKMERD